MRTMIALWYRSTRSIRDNPNLNPHCRRHYDEFSVSTLHFWSRVCSPRNRCSIPASLANAMHIVAFDSCRRNLNLNHQHIYLPSGKMRATSGEFCTCLKYPEHIPFWWMNQPMNSLSSVAELSYMRREWDWEM